MNAISAENIIPKTDSICEAFFCNAARTPEKLAICCEYQSLNYAQLAGFVQTWTNVMISHGVKRGDHIGVVLPNSIEFVALLLVAANLGVALVPLNTSLSATAIQCAFNRADVKHIVSNAATFKAFDSSGVDFKAFNGVWISIDEAFNQALFLTDLMRSAPNEKCRFEVGQPDDAFILTMTSGSTGDPKPIVLTQRTKYNRVINAQMLYSLTDQDITLAATPLYHSLAERLVLIPLITGGSSILMTRYSANEWLNTIQNMYITFSIAVSSQLKQIAALLESSTFDTSSLRCLVSSSAQLDAEIKFRLVEKLNCEFHECYGASEIAIASNLDGNADKNKLKTVGQAVQGVDIKILNHQDDVANHGEIGEIVCKTTMLFGGYYKRPELTKAAMWGDYFRTGDIGKLDEDGFLYYLGRKKDIIISGGINIYPNDIEVAVNHFDDVMECAAFAYADQQLGEVVAVAIVPKDIQTFNLKQVRFHCAEQLADYQQPRKWFILDALPKNSMGKVMKFELVNIFQSG